MSNLSYKRSFVFLNVKVKKINDIIEDLITLDEVKEVQVITGKMDLLVVLETKSDFSRDEETVTEFVINKIGKLNGVEDTNTIIPTMSKYKW